MKICILAKQTSQAYQYDFKLVKKRFLFKTHVL